MRANQRRRLVCTVAAASLIALGAPLALTATASADPAPAQAQSAEARADSLPSDVKTAIQRDLHISPLEFILRGDAANTAGQLAGTLDEKLGADKIGGEWFDPATKKLKIAVVDNAAAEVAKAAGADTVIRGGSKNQLAAAQKQLRGWALSLPVDQRQLVLAVSTNQQTGQGLVQLQNTDAGKSLGAHVPGTGIQVQVTYLSGVIKGQEDFVGGEGYLVKDDPEAGGGYGACSVGFNAVDKSGNRYAISAGHCAEEAHTWVENGKDVNDDKAFGTFGSAIGTFDKVELSDLDKGGKGHDYSTIKLGNKDLKQLPAVKDYKGGVVQITGVTDPVEGMPVCKSGRTANYTCGTVKAVNEDVTVNYTGEGPGRKGGVQHMKMFEADYCSEPGDSGGSVISGDKAVGINDAGAAGSDGFSCPSKHNEGVNHAFAQALTTDVLPDFHDNLFVETTVQAATIGNPGARTAETKPVISGTATRGATVTVSVDGTTEGTAFVGNNGMYSVPVKNDLKLGKHQAVVSSKFGDQSGPDAKSTFDVVPAAPKITTPAGDYTGPNARPTIAGTAQPNADLTIAVDGMGEVKLTSDAAGKWSRTADADLKPGSYVIHVTQTVSSETSDPATLKYTVTGPGGGPTGGPTTGQPVPTTGPGNHHGGLASTGLSSLILPIGIGALVLIGGGVALIMRSRKKAPANTEE